MIHLKPIFTIVLLFFGSFLLSQDEKSKIDIQTQLIDADTLLKESTFQPNIETRLIVRHNQNEIRQIIQKTRVNYGEIKSVLYLTNNKPIKIIETEYTYYFLPDSIAEIKGYSADIKENFRVESYITNWDKKQRHVLVNGEPSEKKNISYKFVKYAEILRKSKQLIKS